MRYVPVLLAAMALASVMVEVGLDSLLWWCAYGLLIGVAVSLVDKRSRRV